MNIFEMIAPFFVVWIPAEIIASIARVSGVPEEILCLLLIVVVPAAAIRLDKRTEGSEQSAYRMVQVAIIALGISLLPTVAILAAKYSQGTVLYFSGIIACAIVTYYITSGVVANMRHHR